jgi:hypothetical protein
MRTEWCQTCALPSEVVFDVLLLTDDGVSKSGEYRHCDGCVRSTDPR